MTQKVVKQIVHSFVTGNFTIEYEDGTTKAFNFDQLPVAELNGEDISLKVFGEVIDFNAQEQETVAAAQILATITGTPAVDEELEVSLPAGWSGTYQWTLDGVPINGETNATYTVVEGDVGGEIACEVSALTFTTSAGVVAD